MDVNLRAALLGLATGARSSYGLAAVILTTPSPSAETPAIEHAIGSTPGKAVGALLAVGETVGDKLPQTPARTQPPGLVSRLAGAAGAGALIARRYATPPALPTAIAVGGAAATSWGGVWCRARLAKALGSDTWGAVIEDGVAATLAVLGVRR